MKKIFLSGLFIISASFLYAQVKTENIIIVTLDGFRWQEVFSGADSVLVNDSTYVQDTGSLRKEFWVSSAEERRKKLLPFFWTTIQSQGQLYGNRWKENKVSNANKYWFSYPGYNEIFTGYPDDSIPMTKFGTRTKTYLSLSIIRENIRIKLWYLLPGMCFHIY